MDAACCANKTRSMYISKQSNVKYLEDPRMHVILLSQAEKFLDILLRAVLRLICRNHVKGNTANGYPLIFTNHMCLTSKRIATKRADCATSETL